MLKRDNNMKEGKQYVKRGKKYKRLKCETITYETSEGKEEGRRRKRMKERKKNKK